MVHPPKKIKSLDTFTFSVDSVKHAHGLVTVDEISFAAAVAYFMNKKRVRRVELDTTLSRLLLTP